MSLLGTVSPATRSIGLWRYLLLKCLARDLKAAQNQVVIYAATQFIIRGKGMRTEMEDGVQAHEMGWREIVVGRRLRTLCK